MIDLNTVESHIENILSELKMSVEDLEETYNDFKTIVENSTYYGDDAETLVQGLALWVLAIKLKNKENLEYDQIPGYSRNSSYLTEQQLIEAYNATNVSLYYAEMTGRLAIKIMRSDENITYRMALIKANKEIDYMIKKYSLTQKEITTAFLTDYSQQKSIEAAAIVGFLAKEQKAERSYEESASAISNQIKEKLEFDKTINTVFANRDSNSTTGNVNNENLDSELIKVVKERVHDLDENKVDIVDCNEIFKFLKSKFGDYSDSPLGIQQEIICFIRLVVSNTDSVNNTADVITKINHIFEKYGLSFAELDDAIFNSKATTSLEQAAEIGLEAKRIMSVVCISYQRALGVLSRLPHQNTLKQLSSIPLEARSFIRASEQSKDNDIQVQIDEKNNTDHGPHGPN